MSFRMLQLANMEVTQTSHTEDTFNLVFGNTPIIKTMDNAKQKTRWQQAGQLWIRQVQNVQCPEHALPYLLQGGDLIDNNYIYRNSVRLPLHSHGYVGIEWQLRDTEQTLEVYGKEIEIVLSGTANYIEHLDQKDP